MPPLSEANSLDYNAGIISGQLLFIGCASNLLWYNSVLMQREIRGDLVYHTFHSLNNHGILTHAISTRHGGISPTPFHTLNLSRSIGDETTNVQVNIERLHGALGLNPSATISASQAQADRVALVGAAQRGTIVREVDALLTNEPGLPLMLRYADCVPILLFDPVHRAIGVVHAGWRGTVSKIAANAAQAMFDAFSTQPGDLIACIAPSIGPCCYAIRDDVIARLRTAFDKPDELLTTHPDGQVHFNLWEANAQQLRAIGVEQIEIAGICTADHTGDFYSWRAENAKTGRFGAIISLAG